MYFLLPRLYCQLNRIASCVNPVNATYTAFPALLYTVRQRVDRAVPPGPKVDQEAGNPLWEEVPHNSVNVKMLLLVWGGSQRSYFRDVGPVN